jgi:hypothetical protein
LICNCNSRATPKAQRRTEAKGHQPFNGKHLHLSFVCFWKKKGRGSDWLATTIRSALMGQLATLVAGKPGLAVNDTTLTIDLAVLSEMRNIKLGGKLNVIEAKSGTLALDFS